MTQHEAKFEPEAEQELRAAAHWYDDRQRGLGTNFVEHIDAALERVLAAPHAFPLVEGFTDVRRVLVMRFPYALVYMVDGDVVRVLSVAHGRRRPLFWAGRAQR